jgi:HlyD family secretion protein
MSRKRRIILVVALALVLVASGGGFYYFDQARLQAQAPTDTPVLSTARVTRGDLVITASGSGTLSPASETAVGFRSAGVLAELLVKVGDQIQAGDVLARLESTDAQAQVSQAEISLRQAELGLATLTQQASPADVAAAQASLAQSKADLTSLTAAANDQEVVGARETLKSAQEALDSLLAGPDPDAVASAKADLTLAEMSLRQAQSAYDQVSWRSDVAMTQQAADLWQATTNYDKAKAAYDEAVKGPTDEEVAAARAQVAQAQSQLDALVAAPDSNAVSAAQAQVTQAQAALDSLLNGASAEDLETAQLNVNQAQLNLESAQRQLQYTELVAPVSGTVLSVDAQVGESVGTTAIVTLADLAQPEMLLWVEESDLIDVAPGNAVNITFDALPDYTFPGKILSVDPALVTVDNTPAVQARASVDLSAHPVNLISGMNADVEVVAGEARNVLLAPVQALRDLGNDQYAVMVVNASGELELRPVEVGLKDFVNAEIRSGLNEGDVVSLGTAKSSQSSSQNSNSQPQNIPAGPVRFFGGE